MDDFGTGYSSLGYLCSFEFDRIKIDRSFIVGLERHGNYAAVIRMIVSLAKSLGVSTTAEGVETLQQLEMIRAMGCTEVQGYLFSPPKPLEQIRYMTNPREAQRPQRVQIGNVGAQREEANDFASAQAKPVKAALRDAG
jgi:EAL domain-containing protein (putative c-di-GMP-specific phosphodiesterase class I)